MRFSPVNITLLHHLTVIKGKVTINADKLFTGCLSKLQILSSPKNLHELSQFRASNLTMKPGETHHAKVVLFWICNTIKMKPGFWNDFHFPWPLILLSL